MSAQAFDEIVYEGKKYWLAALPLEDYFRANPALRPVFKGFDSACMRGYMAKWEVKDDGRVCLVGMDMVMDTDATFGSLFPEGELFAGWICGELHCPYGGLLTYEHAGFARKLEHELILTAENGVVTSAKVMDN